MELLAADVARLCRALGIGPCHVVGHSLGGMVGLRLALDEPELVRSLSVVNSTAFGGGTGARSLLLRGFIRLWGMQAFARLNAKLHLPEPGQEALRKRFVDTMGRCTADGYLATQHAVDHFDARARLAEISCPVLVVHSELDPIPLSDKELIAKRVKTARLVTVEGSRHVVLWDQPAQGERT